LNYTKKFEDIKGLIRGSTSNIDRQYNGQNKKDTKDKTDLQNITQKNKDRATRTPPKTGSDKIHVFYEKRINKYFLRTFG